MNTIKAFFIVRQRNPGWDDHIVETQLVVVAGPFWTQEAADTAVTAIKNATPLEEFTVKHLTLSVS